MSDLEINFKTGNGIMPAMDMPFFGIGPGNVLPLELKDDGLIWCSTLSWSKQQLAEEINNGSWFFLTKRSDQIE